eukprot:CFRG6402T1
MMSDSRKPTTSGHSYMSERPSDGEVYEESLPPNWQAFESNRGFLVGCLITSEDSFQHLRDFVGSIDDLDIGVAIVVFTPRNALSDNFKDEISEFRWVSLCIIPEHVNSIPLLLSLPNVFKTVSNFFITHVQERTNVDRRFMDTLEDIRSGVSHIFENDYGVLVGVAGRHTSFTTVSVNHTRQFQKNQPKLKLYLDNPKSYQCSLLRRLPQLKIEHREVTENVPSQVCLCIATYVSKWEANNSTSIPLVSIVVKSFLETLTAREKDPARYTYAIWIGLQVDLFFDRNPERVDQISRTITTMAKSANVSVSVHFRRYPLNPRTVDITWKYNRLLIDSYHGGCDYLYQYSDDAKFLTPWVDTLVGTLKARGGFGSAGAEDTNYRSTMELGLTSRLHMEMLGYFWPPKLKNFYSDDFIQQLYGKYLVRPKNVIGHNTQIEGRRYDSCPHKLLEEMEVQAARMKIYEWLRYHPQHNQHAEKRKYMGKLLNLPIIT